MKVKFHTSILFASILIGTNLANAATRSDLITGWKQQGLLTLSIPVKIDDLDPIAFLNAHTKFSLPLIYEPLVSVGSEQELQPILAKSWKLSGDNKSIIITINPNHYFSDHTEVTARDIANSITRVCSPKSKSFQELKGLNGCEERALGKQVKLGMSIIDKYHIKFNIHCSPTNFLFQLASPINVVTKMTHSKLIGSGPYLISDKTSEYLVLKKNPYAAQYAPSKNNGVAIFYCNWKELPTILKQEKPDGSIMYRMQDLENTNNNDYQLVKVNPNITEILVLNNQKFPFNNLLFRKAFSAAFYNHFDTTFIFGAHKPYGLIPIGTGGSIADSAPKKLPEISTKELMNQIPDLKNKKIKITLHQLDDSKNNVESEQIIKIAKQFNIDLNFKYHKNFSTLKPLYLNHQLDGFIELYVLKNREAFSILQFFTKSGVNHANLNTTAIDDMLKKAINEPSLHKRYQAYQNITNYIQNEGAVIPLFYMDHGSMISHCLTGMSDNFLFNPFLHITQLHKIVN